MIVKTVSFLKVTFLILICVFTSCINKKNQSIGEDSPNESDFEQNISYTNPVVNEDFPDPAILKLANGWYYAYATQSIINGESQNIQVARSKDLINWERLGDAMPDKPLWGDNNFWAPDVLYDREKEKYFMYYSAESNDENIGKCLGVAVSNSPEGPFIDKGEPLLCGKGFVNIDPMAFDDPANGNKLLYWGSGFEPIKVRELTNDRLDFKKNSKTVNVVYPGKDNDYNNLIEGAWVIKRNGYYYLFYSGDNCCGNNANYAVMVARGESAEGPFTRFGEVNGTGSSVILEQKNDWLAPGHNSIIQDSNKQDWILYHAINPSDRWLKNELRGDRKDKRVMLIDKLNWENGWPIVKNKKPSVTPQDAPATELSNE